MRGIRVVRGREADTALFVYHHFVDLGAAGEGDAEGVGDHHGGGVGLGHIRGGFGVPHTHFVRRAAAGGVDTAGDGDHTQVLRQRVDGESEDGVVATWMGW